MPTYSSRVNAVARANDSRSAGAAAPGPRKPGAACCPPGAPAPRPVRGDQLRDDVGGARAGRLRRRQDDEGHATPPRPAPATPTLDTTTTTTTRLLMSSPWLSYTRKPWPPHPPAKPRCAPPARCSPPNRSACCRRSRSIAPGFPYGSVTPYALSAQGAPLLLLSRLAAHTKNLLADPRASLFVGDRSAAEDPQAGARVSLLGRVAPALARGRGRRPTRAVDTSRVWPARRRLPRAGRLLLLAPGDRGGAADRRLRRDPLARRRRAALPKTDAAKDARQPKSRQL